MNYRQATLALLAAAMVLLPHAARSQAPDDSYREANAHFEQGDHAAAAKLYQELARSGHFSSELFYNLGAAAFRQNQTGEALLWFRRAQILSPSMPEVRQSMEFARHKVAFLEFAHSNWQQVLRRQSPHLGAGIRSVGIWLVVLPLTALLLLPGARSRKGRWISLMLAGGLLTSGGSWLDRYYRQHLDYEAYATVIAENSEARTAPAPDAKTVIALPPGSEVRLLQTGGHWTYVEVPGDLRGWVRSEQVEANWPIRSLAPDQP